MTGCLKDLSLQSGSTGTELTERANEPKAQEDPMSEGSPLQPTVIQLFRKWRGGDEAAGQEMAQKFSDWYYAISTIRVPGQEGRPPMEAACQGFAQGIITVTRPRALVDWAHDLLERELMAAGYGLDANKGTGADTPNAMTRNRSPQELIQNVTGQIEPGHLRVLALAYDPATGLDVVDRAADSLGGTPFAMLEARYALKRALRDTQDVPFAVVPDEADMDRAPISLYEAHRLASGQEVSELEKWLLSDIELCKDIAEFSAFVHALRGGALAEFAEPIAKPAPQPAPAPETPVDEPTEAPSPVPETASAVEPAPAPSPPPAQKAPTPTPEPGPAEPEAAPAVTPPPVVDKPPASQEPAPRGSNLKAVLITGATLVAAAVLGLLILILALRS